MQHLPPDARASMPDECPCGRFATGRCKWCRVGFCDLHADLVEGQLYCAACDHALRNDTVEAAPLPAVPQKQRRPAVEPVARTEAVGGPGVAAGTTSAATEPPLSAEPAPRPPAPSPMAAYAAWAAAFVDRMQGRVAGSGRAGLVLDTLGAELIYHSQNPDVGAGVAFSIGWKVRNLPETSASYASGQYLILPDDVFPDGGVITTYSQGDRIEAVFDPKYDGPLFGPAVAEQFMTRMRDVEAQLERIAKGIPPRTS